MANRAALFTLGPDGLEGREWTAPALWSLGSLLQQWFSLGEETFCAIMKIESNCKQLNSHLDEP